ncbi:unnamed protein product [Schistosoma mattheei]|uniref:Uncharacterized protein n=1 Tax=Schistosoma mattheei TaxID=31246 RepID=A0A183NRC3_9TREM|nr:unnamed protein product [Schistosoma mattheei]
MPLGPHQQGVPVIMRELMFPDGFTLVSPSFTVRDVTIELAGLRLSPTTILSQHSARNVIIIVFKFIIVTKRYNILQQSINI